MAHVLTDRLMITRQIGQGALLETVRIDGRTVRLFFDAHTNPDTITFPDDTCRILETVIVNGCPCVLCDIPPETKKVLFLVDGDLVAINPAMAEQNLFETRNVIIAERNGEPAKTVLRWLQYHVTRHGLSGVVLLDRSKPGQDPDFNTRLDKALHKARLDCPVVLLRSEMPLGKPGFAPEAHPINVAESPGKDRMDIPPPDPWRAPLGWGALYEAIRTRFLGKARAVANIDVHDLLDDEGPSIFDRVQNTRHGLIPLYGQHCFPWRVRPGDDADFSDHLCVQFDSNNRRQRWCIAPAKLPETAIWRLVRIGNAIAERARPGAFYRFMALRHPTRSVSQIVPKTSLIENPKLLTFVQKHFNADPARIPDVSAESPDKKNGRRVIITCMKNEGPFILEWLAYHRAIGFDDFLIYTNDCDDGTDQMMDLLASKGLVQHRQNPYREVNMKPQHAALSAGDSEPVITDAEWVASIDVDEYINIKTGDGTLDALFAAVPDANMIAMTWRLFGNGDVHEFRDGLIIEQFLRCAPEFANKPHQAWGFKTLFQHIGLFKKLGVHRPKGLNPQLWEKINWVNGSGRPLPRNMFRNAWRSDARTYGYDLVQLNHYAVRSAESFLVKRDRGRVNHVDRDQGLAYWFRMNNNNTEDHSILKRIEMTRAEYDRLMSDPDIAAVHETCVASHQAKIDALRATENYANFYTELTGPRLEKLSRLHPHFGANVFLRGPEVVPDEIVAKDPEEDFFFTVEEGETTH